MWIKDLENDKEVKGKDQPIKITNNDIERGLIELKNKKAVGNGEICSKFLK